MLQRIDYAALARRLLRGRARTTRSLAAELGLSQAAVSRLANGKTGVVSADVGVALIRMAGGTVQVPVLEPDGREGS